MEQKTINKTKYILKYGDYYLGENAKYGSSRRDTAKEFDYPIDAAEHYLQRTAADRFKPVQIIRVDHCTKTRTIEETYSTDTVLA